MSESTKHPDNKQAEQQVKPKLHSFYFPSAGRTVKAETQEEAEKIAKKSHKQNKEDK